MELLLVSDFNVFNFRFFLTPLLGSPPRGSRSFESHFHNSIMPKNSRRKKTLAPLSTSTERTSRSKGPVVSKVPVVTTLTSYNKNKKAISLDDLNLKHSVWTHDDNIELMGVLRERYDANTGRIPWNSVAGIGPTKISRNKDACKWHLRVIKDHNPTMSMTELLDPDNIGKIKFRKVEYGSMIGRRIMITPDEMAEMVVYIKEQRQLKPPKLINKKQIVEYYTQQNNGVQKFGLDFAKKLIKMVNDKEVTPPQTKLGTTTNKQFIFNNSKDADYNLLKKARIHFL